MRIILNGNGLGGVCTLIYMCLLCLLCIYTSTTLAVTRGGVHAESLHRGSQIGDPVSFGVVTRGKPLEHLAAHAILYQTLHCRF